MGLRAAVTTHLRELERSLEATTRLRSRLSRLLASIGTSDGSLTDELIQVMEEMTMLDSPVRHGISVLVYADLESAYDYLVRVFALGPASSHATTPAGWSTASWRQGTGWCGFDQPYGYREYSARDSEGGLWSFMKRIL